MAKSKTKKTKGLIVGIIILLILSLSFLFIGIVVSTFGEQEYNEENTTEYSATIERLEESKDGYHIYLKEYSAYILVKSEQLNSQDIPLSMDINETVIFRTVVENIFDFNEVDYTTVVSLKTETKEYITLENSTKILKQEILNGKILGIVFSLLTLICAVIMIVLVIRRKRYNKQNYCLK